MGLFSVSYPIMWCSLELSLMVCLLYFMEKDSRVSVVFYYYIVQIISSMFMIVGIMVSEGVLVEFSFAVKIGLFPMFGWVISVMWGLGLGLSVWLLLFTQKMIPFVLMARLGWLVEMGDGLLMSVILMSMIVGSVFMCIGEDLKWILVMSSLVHTSWVTYILMGLPGSFMYYFILYGVVLGLVLVGDKDSSWNSWIYLLVIMSSVPPMVGFLLKFYSLSEMSSWVVVFVVVGVGTAVMVVVGYFISLVKFCVVGKMGGEGLGGSVKAVVVLVLMMVVGCYGVLI
uniref:ND2 protein n=1 Tax=Southwellina hispida TaxID=449650 RepID=A0A0C4MWS6_9BILA|nr:NADH dehydrogenase subunit 2 [Southwellina hispida]AIO11167.1 NADH dehydrogenase subunit 2 [Southwellina hispida]